MSKSVSVALVGPHRSGKTTALSRLCVEVGAFADEEHESVRELAKALGRPDAVHAWLLDSLATERERGITVESSLQHFTSPGEGSCKYVGIDTPGHPDYTKNMLSLTSLTDIAVLVIPAAVGEYEECIRSLRLRELALCCFTMGIKHIAVLVTKMDHESVDFSVTRFEDIKKSALTILKEVGYKTKAEVIPGSGVDGGNIVAKSPQMTWYEGSPLLSVLDGLHASVTRPADKPLRLPILKVYEIPGTGTVITGRVETGSFKNGTKLVLAPSGHTCEVESIEVNGESVSDAKAGDIVGVAVTGSFRRGEIKRGMVASSDGVSNDPACTAETLLTQVVVLEHPGRIKAGYCPSIAVHTAQVPCEFESLLSRIDRKTGKEVETNPESVGTGEVFMARLRPRAQVCIESFATYPSLGRFAVLDGGRTVAVGVVKEVTKRPMRKVRNRDENEYFDD